MTELTAEADRLLAGQPGTKCAIKGSDVGLHFSGLVVLRDLSFTVQRGETYGIVGPNGAGKTSLLNCLSGTYPCSSGSISILGRPTAGMRPHRVVELGVARTFQNVGAFRDMVVIDVVLLGRHTRMRHGPFFYATGIPMLRRVEREHRDVAMEALEFVGLANVAERRVGDLPYGAAKLVDLARTLAAEVELLLLDEPMAGLSHAEREATAELLMRIRDERQVTQVLVEHNMQLATMLCHRLLALSGGAKLGEGAPADVLGDEQVKRAFLGGGSLGAR